MYQTHLTSRESESHRGHAGFQEGGESHFRVRLISADFVAQSRIARHRAVHAALGKDLMGEIHALALDLSTP
ncbi:MAG: BolA family transcriptional regulator [Rhodobacteraceae bacterium]|nr:BolA family transcriptional regulator [Paracoccaceae bacterium]